MATFRGLWIFERNQEGNKTSDSCLQGPSKLSYTIRFPTVEHLTKCLQGSQYVALPEDRVINTLIHNQLTNVEYFDWNDLENSYFSSESSIDALAYVDRKDVLCSWGPVIGINLDNEINNNPLRISSRLSTDLNGRRQTTFSEKNELIQKERKNSDYNIEKHEYNLYLKSSEWKQPTQTSSVSADTKLKSFQINSQSPESTKEANNQRKKYSDDIHNHVGKKQIDLHHYSNSNFLWPILFIRTDKIVISGLLSTNNQYSTFSYQEIIKFPEISAGYQALRELSCAFNNLCVIDCDNDQAIRKWNFCIRSVMPFGKFKFSFQSLIKNLEQEFFNMDTFNFNKNNQTLLQTKGFNWEKKEESGLVSLFTNLNPTREENPEIFWVLDEKCEKLLQNFPIYSDSSSKIRVDKAFWAEGSFSVKQDPANIDERKTLDFPLCKMNGSVIPSWRIGSNQILTNHEEKSTKNKNLNNKNDESSISKSSIFERILKYEAKDLITLLINEVISCTITDFEKIHNFFIQGTIDINIESQNCSEIFLPILFKSSQYPEISLHSNVIEFGMKPQENQFQLVELSIIPHRENFTVCYYKSKGVENFPLDGSYNLQAIDNKNVDLHLTLRIRQEFWGKINCSVYLPFIDKRIKESKVLCCIGQCSKLDGDMCLCWSISEVDFSKLPKNQVGNWNEISLTGKIQFEQVNLQDTFESYKSKQDDKLSAILKEIQENYIFTNKNLGVYRQSNYPAIVKFKLNETSLTDINIGELSGKSQCGYLPKLNLKIIKKVTSQRYIIWNRLSIDKNYSFK